MGKQVWERETGNGTDNWSLKGYKDVEDIENDARHGDVVAMVVYLAAVVLAISTVCGALLAGIVRTIVLKANPGVNQDWLGNEIIFIFWMTFVMITLAQVGLILVHGHIGTLIAKHRQ